MLGEALWRSGACRMQRGSVSVLVYHAITAASIEDDYQMSISAADFASHMLALRSSGIDVLPLADAVERAAGHPDVPPAVSVTFDDGYVGVHEFALEILARHDIPSTLFVTAGDIGRTTFAGEKTTLGRPLAWSEVEELSRRTRCTVGSHTYSHPVLASLSDDPLRAELRRSRETIADHLGKVPQLFAYPYGAHGSFSERSRRALVDEGFTTACTTVCRTYRSGDDLLAVPRVRVSWCDTTHELMKAIAGCYDWFRLVQWWQTRSARQDRKAA